MPLQSSGLISLSDVAVELKRASNAYISMNEFEVRKLGDVPSGVISLSNFYGKANELIYTLSSAYQNANLRNICNSMGYPGTVTIVRVRVNGTMSSTSTGIPAMEVGSWPAGVTLIVEIAAAIIGKGGAGGAGGPTRDINGSSGGAGGMAIRASWGISGGSITLSMAGGVVYGGGGGGGGGGGNTTFNNGNDGGNQYYTGGTGGRGAGTDGGNTSGATAYNAGTGGTGGWYGNGGGAGSNYGGYGGAGGAGGRSIINSANCNLSGWSAGGNYFGVVA